jgi:5'-nucleotidase / UDP-sugar diphosphatase
MRSVYILFLIVQFSFMAISDDHSHELTILHMNDIHSHLLPYPYAENQARFGGIARATALIESIRSENPNTLVLNAGDLLVGDFMYAAMYDYPDAPILGFAEFYIINMMKFDAFALGNHEFDVGPDLLYAVLSHELIQENLPPILSANISNIEAHPGLASIVRPDTILIRGDLAIGIIGFITEETNQIANPAPLEIDALWEGQLTDPSSLAPKEKYQSMIDNLRERGADIVIALTHVGHAGETALARLYDGIDIIIGGHSHSPIQTVLDGTNGNNVPYARAGAYTRYLSELSVMIENNLITGHQFDLHTVFDSPDSDEFVDAAVLNFKNQVEQKWEGVYSDIVNEIPFYMDGLGETDGNVDKEETNLGNLITDAMRDKLETDIAIEAAGVIRQSLLDGDATPADIYRVLSMGFHPIDNVIGMRLIRADVTAFALAGALEFAVSSRGSSFFFQVSGIAFEYDSSKPFFERLDATSIRVNGEPIDWGATYSVAINEYVAGFGIQLGFVTEANLQPTGFVQYEVFRDYLASADMSNYEETEGRIVDTAEPVSVPVAGEVPLSFELKQNYPNPFNPVTTITYQIDRPSFVSLEIYNLLGQKITTLVEGELDAGIHRAQFDASNPGGHTLASGIYVYRLTITNDEIGRTSKVRNMVYLK